MTPCADEIGGDAGKHCGGVKISAVTKENLYREVSYGAEKLSGFAVRKVFKLISRETGHSSYALLKEFKSGFSAFTYQMVGSTFGYNLKKTYDPTGEDLLIESIVQQIESGQLQAIPPPVRPALAPPAPKRKAARRKADTDAKAAAGKQGRR